MNPYSQFIHKSRYARFRDDLGRRETWEETITRYLDYFEQDLDERHSYKLPQTLRSELYDAIHSLSIMPSMRAMMTAGEAARRCNVGVFNCSFSAIDTVRSFSEILYILMCGTGVGFSVERQSVSQLPPVPDTLTKTDHVIVVGDSKQGWAEAYNEFLQGLYAGHIARIDYSEIRPAGARLMTFGGRSSGPEPLRELFEFTIQIFHAARGRKLNSLECHSLCCKIGEIVVVGGVRRSALISLSNLSDQRMRDAKSGNWWMESPYLALANNSVAYTEKPEVGSFMDEWSSLYRSRSGERGIFNRQGAVRKVTASGRRDPRYDFGTNPCVTGDTLLTTDKGDFPIAALAGTKQNVWNGEKFTPAQVKKTSNGCAVLTVTFCDGEEIRATPYHKWYVWSAETHKETETTTGNLKLRDLIRFKCPDGRIRIVSVTGLNDYGEFEPVYCANEPNRHRIMLNGILTGNCGEIILRSREFCNLTETVVRPDDTESSLAEKIRLASILGTFQSTQTTYQFLSDDWRRNSEEERLLGVSLTGIFNSPLMSEHGPDLRARLSRLKAVAISANVDMAHQIGIPVSAAVTTVKPSGTVSALVNCPSGIHPSHAPYYIRRVRGDNKDPLTAFLRDAGVPCEPAVGKEETTSVFSFPMQSHATRYREDISAIEHLRLIRDYNMHWSEHAVSCTVSVRENEWPSVGGWVFDHFDELAGVSFLPFFEGDTVYPQMPYETITREAYEAMAKEMPESIPWDILATYEGGKDHTKGSQELACVAGACEIVDIS